MRKSIFIAIALIVALLLMMFSTSSLVSASTYGWTTMTNPSTDNLNDVWGSSPSDVYDNGFDQVIGGGSIIIHTKK